jgi:hypothetical protein
MEDVLDVCHRPYDPKRPAVNLDEKPVQSPKDVREPLPQRPGETAEQDHEYKRNGTANIFVAFEPPANWRTLAVTERRTSGERGWTSPTSSRACWTGGTRRPRRWCW